MGFSTKAAFTIAATLLAIGPLAQGADLQTDINSRSFSVNLGATRIVYPQKSSGEQLSVSNLQDYPILVQSSVTGEDNKSAAPFLVTPPLFRLEAHQQSRLRVIRTDDNLPTDRESLFWMCVKAVPPSDDDATTAPEKVSLAINMAVNTCEKILYRPSGLKGTAEEAAGSLEWSRHNNTLQVFNKTPFYMNLKSLIIGKTELHEVSYISPYGQVSWSIPAGADGDVIWTVINDQGGVSRRFKVALM